MPEESSEYRVLRALTVIEVICQQNRLLTMGDLLQLCDLPRATVYRLVNKLVAEGYLYRQTDGRGISVGHKLFKLANGLHHSDNVRLARHEILKALASQTGETCNLAVPASDRMRYINRVETHWPLRLHMSIDTRVPIHCTASGKLYLAYLAPDEQRQTINSLLLTPEASNTLIDKDSLLDELAIVRQRQYATDNEEFISGVVALAVPILSGSQRMLASVAVTAPTSRMTLDDAIVHLPALREAAGKLSDYLDHAQHHD